MPRVVCGRWKSDGGHSEVKVVLELKALEVKIKKASRDQSAFR